MIVLTSGEIFNSSLYMGLDAAFLCLSVWPGFGARWHPVCRCGQEMTTLPSSLHGGLCLAPPHFSCTTDFYHCSPQYFCQSLRTRRYSRHDGDCIGIDCWPDWIGGYYAFSSVADERIGRALCRVRTTFYSPSLDGQGRRRWPASRVP